MDGLPTGAVGTKTDICVTGSWFRTLLHTPEERKDELLATLTRTYFSADPVDAVSWRIHKNMINAQFTQLAEYPAEFYSKVEKWTSFGKAVWFARHLFPAAELYLVCDLDVVCRSGNDSAHFISSEVNWINSQSDIVNVNEELLQGEGTYSKPLTEEEQAKVNKVDEEVNLAASRVTAQYNNMVAKLKQGGAMRIGPYFWKLSQ
jgi:hypothetical protein